jgi:tRNA(fMet)-specific endonuclease VapC
MNRLLDTNIRTFLIRRRPAALIRRLTSSRAGELALSSITVAELRFGVEKSRDLARDQGALEQFPLPFAVVDFDRAAAVAYGRVRADLAGKGTPLGALDTLIAAHALRLHVTLVTNNTREFARVPGLNLEDWAQGTAAEETGS